MRLVFIVTFVFGLATGCAVSRRSRAVPDRRRPRIRRGRSCLILGEAAEDVTVAINGVLVVEGVHTKRVVIDNVPAGTAEIIMAANGADKQIKVWVGTDHATTIPLGIPDPRHRLHQDARRNADHDPAVLVTALTSDRACTCGSRACPRR